MTPEMKKASEELSVKIDEAESDELWIDLGGRVACAKTRCIGLYAMSALGHNPEATEIETPISVWKKISVFYPGWIEEEGVECETCEHDRKTEMQNKIDGVLELIATTKGE